jgi:predicted transcriptional regulator
MATTATSIKLDSELKKRIDRLARARDRSPHWLMKQAIEEFVDRQETEEEFRQRAEQALEHYRRTGLHLTNDEVVEWMDRIIAGENPPMPKPHT